VEVIMSEDLKARVLSMFQDKSCGDKKMFYVRDITRWFPGEDRHAVQNILKELIDQELLRYWSSGSTTYIMLTEYFPKEEGTCSE
jgi:hypothetical protein